MSDTGDYIWDPITYKRKFLFKWDGNGLASDISLKAIGLLKNVANSTLVNGCYSQAFIGFCGIEALAVLSSPITIKGRNGGTQTPDILEVYYAISLVGV
jgi:hypothetical protein